MNVSVAWQSGARRWLWMVWAPASVSPEPFVGENSISVIKAEGHNRRHVWNPYAAPALRMSRGYGSVYGHVYLFIFFGNFCHWTWFKTHRVQLKGFFFEFPFSFLSYHIPLQGRKQKSYREGTHQIKTDLWVVHKSSSSRFLLANDNFVFIFKYLLVENPKLVMYLFCKTNKQGKTWW